METFPWASHVQLSDDRVGFAVVFDEGSDEAFAQFHIAMRGLKVAWQPPALMPDGFWVAHIRLTVNSDLPTVVNRMKECFRPQLEVSFADFHLEVLKCATGQHNWIEARYEFVPGFEPKAKEVFHVRLLNRLQRVPLRDFILDPDSEEEQPALLATLSDAYREHIKSLGAFLPSISWGISHCCF